MPVPMDRYQSGCVEKIPQRDEAAIRAGRPFLLIRRKGKMLGRLLRIKEQAAARETAAADPGPRNVELESP